MPKLTAKTLALLGALGSLSVSVAAQLPVPCATGACGATGPQTWVTSGAANLVQVGNLLTITQSSENAVLNWRSFNVSADGTVTFKQPDAAAVALNQIFQADPSKILGALNANGSVYLINQNGIIFGAGAQVNTHSLIASSLNITPAAVNGILNAGLNNEPAFSSFVDANGNPLISGPVQVDSGAKINAPGGEIMLFAPQVTNQGNLRADGGQVILAAGDSVYLAASTDPNLRGLLVEVGHGGTVTNAAASSPGGTNAGQIAANDGNVSMVGLIVNQLGRISATTAVQQNGSIYLLAQDGGSASAQQGAVAATLTATRAGTLNLGADSHTDVTLDLASKSTAVDKTAQPKSQVTLVGQQVSLLGGSEITATSGNVTITASAVPGQSADNFAAQPGTGRLVIFDGASIDVAGANISLPVSSNVIPVQLRGTELADSPIQRTGPLYGQTVYIDTRQSGVRADGTAWVGSPIGDLSGYVSAVQRDVAERSLTGGSIALNSDGAVFVAPKANLNISGGSINYQSAYVNTTKLLGTNGQVYDISQADPNQTYVGIVSNYSLTDPKWGVTQNYPTLGSADAQGQFQSGYVEGKDAGSITIQAPRMVLDAPITATTVIGPLQRQLATAFDTASNLYRPLDQMPASGQLILGLADGGAAGDNYLLPDVVFAAGTVLDKLTGPSGTAFNPLSDPLPTTLNTVYVQPDLLGPNGIGQLTIYANGKVSIPANIALTLPADGALAIKAGAIDLSGGITVHDGSVSLSVGQTQSFPIGGAAATLNVASGSMIDVSGEWINDLPAPNSAVGTAPLAIAGGSVAISARNGAALDLQAGSVIDVSGGAQRTAQGKINGGAAGSVSISEGSTSAGAAVPIQVGATLEGYGLTQGGTLSLTANDVCIAAANCAGGQTGTLWVPNQIFSADGFETISLASNLGGLTVLADTQIAPHLLNFALLGNPTTAPSGTAFGSLAAPQLLPDQFRAPVNVNLRVSPTAPGLLPFDNSTFPTAGILEIEKGAAIVLDAGGSLSLKSDSSIVIDGTLSAPAGSITVATTTNLPTAEFLTSQGIWLEDGARLSTAGVAQLQVNDLGQSTGSVLNGGNISIAANRGYLITDQGSSLDASGTAAEVTLAQNVSVAGVMRSAPVLIGSNGGTISLSAAEGLLLNGAVAAHAGNAPGAAGGVLDVTLDGNLHGNEPGPGAIFPWNPRTIVVTDNAPVIIAAGHAIPSQYNGVALVPAGMINAGGFSALQLSAKNLFDADGPVGTAAPVTTASIVFAGDTTLQLPVSIRLDAPQISTTTGAEVQLQSAYVGLGYDDSTGGAQTGYSTSAGMGTSNSGSFEVRAGLVDFIGSLGLGGFGSSTIDSSGDIRFIGVESAGPTPLPIEGTLAAYGSLTLKATQIYPTTLSQFGVSVAGAAANTLEILPSGATGDTVLSAGGHLTLTADSIRQGGVVRAPFGELTFDATQTTLEPGSITSTSGDGQIIPFGSTQAGIDWVYTLPLGQTTVFTQSGPPAKSIQFNPSNANAGVIDNSVVVAKGATIDLSGGGDLQASEFVPGVGGMVDVLSNANTANPGQFAIVPLLALKYAPYDPQSQSGFSYASGSSVVLAGGGGVAAGTYAILPASYALLPGAYLVRPVSGFTDIAPGQAFTQLDGSSIVAGRFAVAGTDIVAGRTQGFDIRPGTAVQELAQYTLTSANAFFSKLATSSDGTATPLPRDAGQLQFLAGQQLEFLGNLVTTVAQGGRGAQVDISASVIDITNGAAASVAAGTVALDAAQLNALGASSLLIGGTRSIGTGTGVGIGGASAIQILTGASSVSVDPGVTLSGSEIMLTASNQVMLSSGASLIASGSSVAPPSEYDITGGGALLRVSTGAQTSIVRTDPGTAMGALTIGPGAVLKSAGSATLEASGNLQSQAVYDLAGGSLAFNATQISLGAAPAGSSGLVLSPAELSTLKLGDLELTSGTSIDIYGANRLAVAGTLTLDAPGIAASNGNASAVLNAKQITFEGAAPGASGAAPASVPSSGDLTLQADHLILGAGTSQISGFTAVAIYGAADIHASAGGSISSDAPLTLHTALLSTADDVNYQIATTHGPLQILGAVAPSKSSAISPGAGGEIGLSGSSVALDTAVSLPSGVLTVSATGPAQSDNVALGSAAAINAAGTSTTFDSLVMTGPGGRVTLNSASGSVSMALGASINVGTGTAGALSIGAPNGTAGALSISAPNGTAELQGTLLASGGTGSAAGQFTLDAGQLPDLTSLNAALNAGGFGGLRGFRQRGAGDVTLGAAADVRANTVTISNDDGSLDVLGQIDASGTTGGGVSLAALNTVDIAGSINASASGANQSGGSLAITSTNGILHIDNSATIDLAGGAGAAGGTLALTVPRTSLTGLLNAGNTSPAITLGGSIRGAQTVQVEGLTSYDAANDALANTISAADIAPTSLWYTDAAAFMNNAAAISAALKGNSGLNVSVLPGIDIQSAANPALGLNGDLTLATAWDLSTWRFNGAPGILTLRAAGNLLIQQSLSDGFNGVTGSGAFILPSVPDRSWSYRLVAGADLNASNLMTVVTQQSGAAAPAGNIEIAAGTLEGGLQRTPVPVMVRTGTGNIDIAAAGDLEFGNRASVIYTAGQDSGLGIALPELANLAYPTAGGNININVGGDIQGAPTNQLVTSWLWRAGQQLGPLSAQSATAWTVNYQWFEENVGALAGGNVSINAGGSIGELSVALPSIGRQIGGTNYTQNAVQVTGGGTLTVQSGADITGGSYFVGRGSATLEAWNSVGANASGAPNATGLAPILALGDASIDVAARGGLTIESVLDPFLLPQATSQPTFAGRRSSFSTYSDASAVSLVSTAGDVTLLNQPGAADLESQLTSMRFSSSSQALVFVAYPGTVTTAALTGNLNIDGQFALWPSATGNLNLLAGQNVVFTPLSGGVLMSGLDPSTLPNPQAPAQSSEALFNSELFAVPTPGAAYTPIHSAAFTSDGQNDPTPVRVVALRGNVSDATLTYIPKPVHVIAGQDITDLTLHADNLSSTDISIVSAGRDISYASPRDVNGLLSPESQNIVVEGPGSLLLEAGRNVNLGTSGGVTTVGNLYNPSIAPGGANISVLTGATIANADLTDFIASYLKNSSAYDSLLLAFVQARSGAPAATKAQALAMFDQLSRDQQFALCEQILYDEIRTGGRAAAAPGPGHDNYSRSFLALSTLFPNSTTDSGPMSATTVYPGSLSLYFSQIYTLDGGDISLLTPGGSVDVGLATPPTAFGISKAPSQLGIVAQSTGNINSVSYGNFLVNQSRVFAADGGDILVWSTDGNVDAGRGAKTAISAPAPTVTFNAQGQIQTLFPAALQGSGIQALATTAGVTPGDVDLYAPQGVVNASDAGIVAGNLTIGATAVLGRNNITVSGVAVGVPVDSSGLGASLAGSSSVSSSAANAASLVAESATKGESAAPLAQSALGFLEVFILGLGEDTCKQDDMECLKRQKAN